MHIFYHQSTTKMTARFQSPPFIITYYYNLLLYVPENWRGGRQKTGGVPLIVWVWMSALRAVFFPMRSPRPPAYF